MKKTQLIENIILLLGILIMIISFLLAAYVEVYVMIIQPTKQCCDALRENTLTNEMIFETVVKCILASPIGTLIFCIGCHISKKLLRYSNNI